MKGQSYVILALIFTIIVAIFAVTNVAPVEVNYFFWKMESPLILVILFSVLMGGIITAAVGMIRMFKLKREIKVLKSQLNSIEAQQESIETEIEETPDSNQ
ncbi:LapA family protein [Ornithinibacillus halophilus]|uniref:Uncharacterized integral membrane protein n=1 Tax=Ornithinibacillus halophilus TaxID=930117 RepID=A0A1M5DGN6_9BACI|nr:lipopolysaccharide assembly protein LapA domain-containing protein [Ornithinibacillus halophilus]SHF66158.1 Uncharacterized integral membrane protein [Ornithinibacillus halophilus]